MAGIFFAAWDEERPDPIDYYDEPDPCPICDDAREIEDDEGFFTDCPRCRPESPFDDDDLYPPEHTSAWWYGGTQQYT